MNTDWETAIAFVLEAEGGYTWDPNDLGGETNFGISKRSYPNENIQDMTREHAAEIYLKDFWRKLRCDELPSPLAITVFDAAVNQGDGGAARMLQIALGVEADGIVGEKTIAAAFRADTGIVRRFMVQRMARYARTVLHNPSQEVFIENWSDRLMRMAKVVL